MLKLFLRIPHEKECNIKSDEEYWNNDAVEYETSVMEIRSEVLEAISPESSEKLKRIFSEYGKGEAEIIGVNLDGFLKIFAEVIDICRNPPWEMSKKLRLDNNPMPEFEMYQNIYAWIDLHKNCSNTLIFDYWCTTAGYKNNPPEREEFFDL